MITKEDVAFKIYELVENRVPTKQIVTEFSTWANVILNSHDYDKLEELIGNYKNRRSGLEKLAGEVFSILKIKLEDDFSVDFLHHDYGWKTRGTNYNKVFKNLKPFKTTP